MKTILLTCYAVNPYKGSEDGTAWNMLLQIARHHRVVAITRENNQADIERYLAEHRFPGRDNLQFYYFDWPYYLRFWKRKNRGALLYFYLWQASIPGFIRRRQIAFALAHNLNFHNDWTPTFLGQLGKPLVWGPVGHHPDYPAEFIRGPYGWRALWLHRLKWWTKRCFWRYDPFLRRAQNQAQHVLAINSQVARRSPRLATKVRRLPAVGANSLPERTVTPLVDFEILSVGRFVPLKGFDLTIRAFAQFYRGLSAAERGQVQLTLVGKGPERERLRALARELSVEAGIKWIEWIEQKDLWDIYRRAALFCFPSHEGAGMVVPEALAAGLPILCLDNPGPGEFVDATCGRKVPYASYETTVAALAEQLRLLYHDRPLRAQLALGARQRHATTFTWERKGEILRVLYAEMLAAENSPSKIEIPVG